MRIWMPFLLLLVGCGSNASSGAQIQLTAAGASPKAITIPSGGQVHFVNHDNAEHQIASADCNELASPRLGTGQDFLATLSGPQSCTFSDGLNPSATNFQGTITVNAPAVSGGSGY